MNRINLRQQSTEKQKSLALTNTTKQKIQRRDSLNCTYKLPLAIVWHKLKNKTINFHIAL